MEDERSMNVNVVSGPEPVGRIWAGRSSQRRNRSAELRRAAADLVNRTPSPGGSSAMPLLDDTETPYGLHRPTMDDARAAVLRVYGGGGPRMWARTLTVTELGGRETDDDSLERVLLALDGADPVSRLCAQALRIRLRSHTYLAEHVVTGSAA
jgi:hypothetical protein